MDIKRIVDSLETARAGGLTKPTSKRVKSAGARLKPQILNKHGFPKKIVVADKNTLSFRRYYGV